MDIMDAVELVMKRAVYLTATCCVCEQIFHCNPIYPPTALGKSASGGTLICRHCHLIAIEVQLTASVPPWPYPRQRAYDPADESMLR